MRFAYLCSVIDVCRFLPGFSLGWLGRGRHDVAFPALGPLVVRGLRFAGSAVGAVLGNTWVLSGALPGA